MKVKRWLVGLLAAVMVMTMLPYTAYAADIPGSTEETGDVSETGDISETVETTEKLTDQEQTSGKETIQAQETQEVPETPIQSKKETSTEESDLADSTIEESLISEEEIDSVCLALGAEALAVGSTVQEGGLTYTVTRLASDNAHGVVSVADGKSVSGAVVVPASIQINDMPYDVTALADSAFEGNANLTSIDLSATDLSSIGQYCFKGCTGLTSVDCPEAIVYTNVKRQAFSGCTALKELTFNYVQILKNTLPFMNSGITRITVLNPVNFGANAFSGLSEGFTLICPNNLEASKIDAYSFGTTKNVTIQVADAAAKTALEEKFGASVTVVSLSGGEETIVASVRDGNGNVTTYTSMAAAFEAINVSEDAGPFYMTVPYTSEGIDWSGSATVPNKKTTIDFSGNNVCLPASLVLQAPLTIKNINNFTNADGGELCTLEAGDNAFVMQNGGSFGFAKISGSNLTFDKILPHSTPLGSEPCQLVGTGNNAVLHIQNVGSSSYIYDLPDMNGFSELILTDAYMKINAGEAAKLKRVTLNNGGLTVLDTVELSSIGGNGTLRFAEGASLTVTDQAEGTFRLPDLSDNAPVPVTVPANSALILKNANGDIVEPQVAVSVVEVSGGNLNNKGYASMAEAMEAIAGDDGNGTYTVILKDNAAMGLDDGSSNTCSLPAKTIVLDGCGYKLSQPVTSRNYLGINGNLTLKNVELDMNRTYLYNYAEGAEITFEGTVTGKLGLAQDKTDKNAEGATFVVCSPVSKTILASLGGNTGNNYNYPPSTTVVLKGYGTAEEPALGRFNSQIVPSAGSSSSALRELVLENSYVPIFPAAYDSQTIKISGSGGISVSPGAQVTAATIYGWDASAGDAQVLLKKKSAGFEKLIVRGEVSGTTKVKISGDEIPEDGTVLVQAPHGAADSFYLDGVPGKSLIRQTNGDYVVAAPTVSVSGGTLNNGVYGTLAAAMDAIRADGGTEYTVKLLDNVNLETDLTLADTTLVLDGDGHTLSAGGTNAYINVPNNLTIRNIKLDLENTSIHYTPNTDDKRVIELESTVSGTVKSLLDDSQSRWLDFKLNGNSVQVGKITGTVSTIGTNLTDLFLTGFGAIDDPISLDGKAETLAALVLDNSFLAIAGDVTDLGTIRTSSKTSGGGLILKDNAAINALSLWTDTAFGIRIPSGKTLTINNNVVGRQIPVSIEGQPEDGQVLIRAAKGAADSFVLTGVDEKVELVWSKADGTYTVHIHSYGEWKSDDINHWHECSCGKKSDEGAHISDNGVVTKEPTTAEAGERTYSCTICGKVLYTETIEKLEPGHKHDFGTKWKFDEKNHWHECSCGEKSDEGAHISDNGVVTKEPTTAEAGERTYSCTICGKVLYTETIEKLEPGHKHDFGTKWKFDEKNHWHECSCGEKSDEGAHISNNGIVTKASTTTEAGERTYSCTVCGKVLRTETIAKEVSSSETPRTGDESHILLWFILLGASMTGLICIVVFNRKKKSRR